MLSPSIFQSNTNGVSDDAEPARGAKTPVVFTERREMKAGKTNGVSLSVVRSLPRVTPERISSSPYSNTDNQKTYTIVLEKTVNARQPSTAE